MELLKKSSTILNVSELSVMDSLPVKKGWIAMFSQSGSELVGICERLGYQPSIVFTNNLNESTFHTSVNNFNIVKWKHDIIMDFLREEYSGKWLITLHGYLRILPADICEKFEVYNGHPGDIRTYPILKGKDPQKKALELKLPTTGTVIHRVTPEVDEGEIMRLHACRIEENETLDSLIGKLKERSIELWVDFLNTRLMLNENWD